MSRASDLRDAVRDRLIENLTVPVWSVMQSRLMVEDLEDGPIVTIRVGGREVEIGMGPDSRHVLLEIVVNGSVPLSDDYKIERSERLAHELKVNDAYDDLTEEILALFTPNGPIAGYIADHRLQEVRQAMTLDDDYYDNYGIWASGLVLRYFDCEDDNDGI